MISPVEKPMITSRWSQLLVKTLTSCEVGKAFEKVMCDKGSYRHKHMTWELLVSCLCLCLCLGLPLLPLLPSPHSPPGQNIPHKKIIPKKKIPYIWFLVQVAPCKGPSRVPEDVDILIHSVC